MHALKAFAVRSDAFSGDGLQSHTRETSSPLFILVVDVFKHIAWRDF
jgi:hypothetical protein